LIVTTGALLARGDAPALVSKDNVVSYRALGFRAGEISRALGAIGVAPGEPVALVSMGRAHDEPVALAGALAHGAVVVPLDASSPPARLAAIVRERRARAILLDEAARSLGAAIEAQTGPIPRVLLDATGTIVETTGVVSPDALPADPSLACILHTSGSTGTPKPVPITREGLDAFTSWGSTLIGLSSSDRVLRVAELVFDLAWFDHVAALRAGASLCTMSRRDLANGRAFLQALGALQPTVVYGVPSLFMKLAAALGPGKTLDPAPRAVFFAGEVFPPRELRAFADKLPEARLWNFYGPTETNVCTYHEVSRGELDGEREIPIGRACPYASCALVAEDDPSRVIEGPGVGELVVSGPTVLGLGPLRTRDRVERKEDGLYHFRGRIDRMIKVRGYRVEPGEIEAALDAHPSVRQSAVVPREDPRLGRTLRAFVELRAGEPPPDERSIRVFLAERLPNYMIPEGVTVLEELPRTSTGKIDYPELSARGS